MAISGALGKLWVELGLKDDLTPGLDNAEKKVGRIGNAAGKTLSGIGKVGKVAGASILAGATALGTIGIAELKEGEQVAAQTAAAITSTGGAAKITAEEIAKNAEAIAMMSGQSDEAIQSGQNMLLTFTDIQNRAGKGNDIFNQATSIMADMSQAMGTDMKGQAIQLGKALNNPTKGVGALSKVGVTFTEQQKEQIAAMQEAGDMAGAQKVILAELQKEFGGSAKAAGQTFAGQIDIAKTSLENMAGEVLSGVMPALQTLLPIVQDVLGNAIKALAPVVEALANAFASIIPALMPIIDLVAEVVVQLVPFIELGVQLMVQVLEPLIPVLLELIKAFLPLLPPILELAKILLPPLAQLLGLVAKIITTVVVKALQILIPPITAVIGWIAKFLGKLSGAKDSIKGILDKVKEIWSNAWNGMKDTFSGIWDGIWGALKTGINFIIKGLNALIDGFNLAIRGMNVVNPFSDIPKIPNIPEFSRGGVVPGPIGEPMLVIAHGGEEFGGMQGQHQIKGDDIRSALAGLTVVMDGQVVGRLVDRRLGAMQFAAERT